MPTDDDGRVIAFIEKPPRDEAPTNLINAGTYVLEPSVLDRIAAGPEGVDRARDLPGDGRPKARLYAMSTDDYWLDTGRPEQYLQANLDLLAAPPRPSVRGESIADRRGRPRRYRRAVGHLEWHAASTLE